MMDSARARTVGSSSTTRTVVGLAFSDFIAPYPLGFENANHGAKAKFQPSQLFHNFDFTCCTYAAKTQTRKQRPTTNWPFMPIVAFPLSLERHKIEMNRSKNTSFADRLSAAAEAKKAQLERAARARSAAESAASVERRMARQAVRVARDARIAERKANKLAIKAREAAALERRKPLKRRLVRSAVFSRGRSQF